jgi:hypothetical protein
VSSVKLGLGLRIEALWSVTRVGASDGTPSRKLPDSNPYFSLDPAFARFDSAFHAV